MKKTLSLAEIIVLSVSFIVFVIAIITLGTSSCESNNSSSIPSIHIRNTQDWTEYIASATTIKEIDDGLRSIPTDVFVNIYEDLSYLVIKKNNDYYAAKNICIAFYWMKLYSPALENRCSEEQWNRIEEIKSRYVLLAMCFTSYGINAETLDKMFKVYRDYLKNGNNQKLYY